ncbi:MAG: PEGA domain-containing protein, partial [Rhodothermales bacterium]
NTNAAYETSLDAGTYVISAVHPALGKWDKRVTVAPGASQDILFNFNREINVTIISDPINAEIFIDGSSTARYTPSQIKLRPGNHTILVKKDGFTLENGAQDIVLENELSSPVAFKLNSNE